MTICQKSRRFVKTSLFKGVFLAFEGRLHTFPFPKNSFFHALMMISMLKLRKDDVSK